jgi:hypothetical protein
LVTHFANGYYPHSLVATLIGQVASSTSTINGVPLQLGLGIVLTLVVVVLIVLYRVIGPDERKAKVEREQAEE